MDSHFERDGLLLNRTPAEMKELVSRLNRLEGQIRGIRAMIEGGRHCRDELQQINAASAALRKVAAILASQHVAAGIAYAVNGENREQVMADLLDVLAVALRQG
jgi:DNA-binding FrmR family transcriptional regulator